MSDNDKAAGARQLLKTHKEATEALHRELLRMHPACTSDLHDAKTKIDAANKAYEDDVLGTITTNG